MTVLPKPLPASPVSYLLSFARNIPLTFSPTSLLTFFLRLSFNHSRSPSRYHLGHPPPPRSSSLFRRLLDFIVWQAAARVIHFVHRYVLNIERRFVRPLVRLPFDCVRKRREGQKKLVGRRKGQTLRESERQREEMFINFRLSID